jgi:penicillin-binding protein
MSSLRLALVVTAWIFCTTGACLAQDHMKGMDMPMKQTDKTPVKSVLQPAEGASVKIISPKAGEVVKGDKVPLQFKLTKGKRGEHVHAYVDGEMMGMFKTEKGTLNGVEPGQHTLELRVTTADHNIELDATDKVSFTTK